MPDSTPRASVGIAACKVPGHALASVPIPGAPLGRSLLSSRSGQVGRLVGCWAHSRCSIPRTKQASKHGCPEPAGHRSDPFLPWRPPCSPRVQAAAGPSPWELARFSPGRDPGRAAAVAGDCPTACAPAGLHRPHALPPARVMREPPAHWLGRAWPPERSPARWPLPCGRGGLRPGGGGQPTGT